MRTNAYSIYDRKALVYGLPFFAPTDGMAVRSFQDLANDANSTVARHPGDFVLFLVGYYDDQDGSLVPVSPVRHIVDANSVLREQVPLPLFQNGKAQLTTEELEAQLRDKGAHV